MLRLPLLALLCLLSPLLSGSLGRVPPADSQAVRTLSSMPTAAQFDPVAFHFPRGVALDTRGNVYVADTENHRIQKLSPQGEPLAQWGSGGSGPGEFRFPRGVALDTQGNIYVADAANNRIQRLSPQGEPLAQFGS